MASDALFETNSDIQEDRKIQNLNDIIATTAEKGHIKLAEHPNPLIKEITTIKQKNKRPRKETGRFETNGLVN